MWDYPPLRDLAADRNRFLLIATSIKAIYDHTARKMELRARLIIAQDAKRVLVKHNCGDSQYYLQQHPDSSLAATRRNVPLQQRATSTVALRETAGGRSPQLKPLLQLRLPRADLRSRRIHLPAARQAPGPGMTGVSSSGAPMRARVGPPGALTGRANGTMVTAVRGTAFGPALLAT